MRKKKAANVLCPYSSVLTAVSVSSTRPISYHINYNFTAAINTAPEPCFKCMLLV
jgi:hypothetical protein